MASLGGRTEGALHRSSPKLPHDLRGAVAPPSANARERCSPGAGPARGPGPRPMPRHRPRGRGLPRRPRRSRQSRRRAWPRTACRKPTTRSARWGCPPSSWTGRSSWPPGTNRGASPGGRVPRRQHGPPGPGREPERLGIFGAGRRRRGRGESPRPAAIAARRRPATRDDPSPEPCCRPTTTTEPSTDITEAALRRMASLQEIGAMTRTSSTAAMASMSARLKVPRVGCAGFGKTVVRNSTRMPWGVGSVAFARLDALLQNRSLGVSPLSLRIPCLPNPGPTS